MLIKPLTVVCAGTATHWPEYLAYNLETDDEEKMQEIKNAAVPYNTVGLLEVRWTPLAGPNEEDEGTVYMTHTHGYTDTARTDGQTDTQLPVC